MRWCTARRRERLSLRPRQLGSGCAASGRGGRGRGCLCRCSSLSPGPLWPGPPPATPSAPSKGQGRGTEEKARQGKKTEGLGPRWQVTQRWAWTPNHRDPDKLLWTRRFSVSPASGPSYTFSHATPPSVPLTQSCKPCVHLQNRA